MTWPNSGILDRYRLGALRTGTGCLAVSAAVAILWPAAVLRSYLVGYLLFFGIAVGSLVILMIHHLTGGRWGTAIGRFLESGSRTLPLLALFFAPIVLGVQQIYSWSAPTSGQSLGSVALLLNVPQFLLRALVYFGCWVTLAYLLSRWSRRRDATADPRMIERLRMLSGPGLVLCGLTLTFASFDWLMSLQPRWYSTIFSIIFASGHVLTAMAFAILLVATWASESPSTDALSPKVLVDLGNLLLTLVMFWAYVSFCQFLLIWMGNLPEEIAWYLPRLYGGWKWVALSLVVFHFAVPFALLLSRDVKRDPRWLAAVAGLVLAMRLVALFWEVLPAFEPKGLWPHWLELAASVFTITGLGGVWLAVFLDQMEKVPAPALEGPVREEKSTHE